MSQQPRVQNFKPSGNTVGLNAATSSGTKALRTGTAQQQNSDVLVTNSGSNIAYITWGDTQAGTIAVAPTAAAPANGVPILAGQTMTLYIGFATWIDAVTLTGTSLVYFTPGLGS